MPAAVFELGKILDDRRFEGLAMPRELPSLLGRASRSDDLVPQDTAANRNWKVDRLSDLWRDRPMLAGNVQEHNDFPCINLSFPAFSKRAVDVLAEFLLPNGEFAPVAGSCGRILRLQLDDGR